MYIYFPIFISCLLWSLSVPSFIGEFPTLCDPVKATKCEHDYLICKQFDGPANDPETTCYCGSIFYGECINDAQVSINSSMSTSGVNLFVLIM